VFNASFDPPMRLIDALDVYKDKDEIEFQEDYEYFELEEVSDVKHLIVASYEFLPILDTLFGNFRFNSRKIGGIKGVGGLYDTGNSTLVFAPNQRRMDDQLRLQESLKIVASNVTILMALPGKDESFNVVATENDQKKSLLVITYPAYEPPLNLLIQCSRHLQERLKISVDLDQDEIKRSIKQYFSVDLRVGVYM
jgi:hypothetical protein